MLDSLHAAQESESLKGVPKSELIRIASGAQNPPRRETVYRWEREGLTKEEYNQRLSKRGRHSKLSPEQVLLLIGYLCHRRQLLLATTQQHLIDFASSHLHTKLLKSSITAMMKKHRISSQRSMARESRLTTEKVVDDAIEFLKLVRSYHYPPHRIIVMDETGLWSNVVQPKTYHFVNGHAILTFLFSSIFEILYFSPLFLPPHF
jgi:hypothetical protein